MDPQMFNKKSSKPSEACLPLQNSLETFSLRCSAECDPGRSSTRSLSPKLSMTGSFLSVVQRLETQLLNKMSNRSHGSSKKLDRLA
jgi:hypothetical protein